jgi:hypothetical protein
LNLLKLPEEIIEEVCAMGYPFLKPMKMFRDIPEKELELLSANVELTLS